MREILLCGLPVGLSVSAGLFLAAAGLLTVTELPQQSFGLLALLPLICGSAAAAVCAARRLRRNGLLYGAFAGLLLTGFWYAAAWALSGHPGALTPLALTVPAGMLGGLIGVGCKAPAIRRRSHLLTGRRARLRLALHLLHRPREKSAHRDGKPA